VNWNRLKDLLKYSENEVSLYSMMQNFKAGILLCIAVVVMLGHSFLPHHHHEPILGTGQAQTANDRHDSSTAHHQHSNHNHAEEHEDENPHHDHQGHNHSLDTGSSPSFLVTKNFETIAQPLVLLVVLHHTELRFQIPDEPPLKYILYPIPPPDRPSFFTPCGLRAPPIFMS
jgi:hypothetical protein